MNIICMLVILAKLHCDPLMKHDGSTNCADIINNYWSFPLELKHKLIRQSTEKSLLFTSFLFSAKTTINRWTTSFVGSCGKSNQWSRVTSALQADSPQVRLRCSDSRRNGPTKSAGAVKSTHLEFNLWWLQTSLMLDWAQATRVVLALGGAPPHFCEQLRFFLTSFGIGLHQFFQTFFNYQILILAHH